MPTIPSNRAILLQAIHGAEGRADELHKIAKDLAPDDNGVDALKEIAASIEKIIQEQKALSWKQRRGGRQAPVTGLDDKQGVVVNEPIRWPKTPDSECQCGRLVAQAITP